MKVEIESFVCNWADEIPHILIRVINAITLSDNKEVLRTAIKQIAEETELDCTLSNESAQLGPQLSLGF